MERAVALPARTEFRRPGVERLREDTRLCVVTKELVLARAPEMRAAISVTRAFAEALKLFSWRVTAVRSRAAVTLAWVLMASAARVLKSQFSTHASPHWIWRITDWS